tara:strand:- start:5929 stop:7119 length:1191 start_codon:yes stop_codon:yes gene_type:complete
MWQLAYPPRDWQKKALSKWKKNSSRGIAKVVTGGGKTYFALMCILEIITKKPEAKIFIIVPTIALRDQWVLDIQDGLGVSSGEIYSHGMNKKIHPDHKVVVMVINSARTHGKKIASNGEWMLIVDECHRAASEENRKALRGEWYATLGLSATPERQYDEWFEEHLIPNLGKVIANYDYVQAKKDRVIAEFELMNYKVPFNGQEEEEVQKLSIAISLERAKMESEGVSESNKLLALLMKRARISQRAQNRIPLALRIAEEFHGRRMLIFHEFISEADQITRLLDDMGFRVAAYHSDLGPSIRFSNLKMYRDGLYDVLVTCKALDEGLNVPNTSVGIIVSSTKSIRQRIQRMGRILRTAEGKDMASIVTIFTEVEQDNLEQEAETLSEISNIRWFGVD